MILLLLSGATLLSPAHPASAAHPEPFVLQQQPRTSTGKKPSTRIDPRTILTQPSSSQPPRQPPHFQVTFAPQTVRVGETVTFTLKPVNIPPGFARPLEIDFGDKTPRQQLESGRMVVTHWYSGEGSYTVGVFLGGLRSAIVRSTSVGDPVTVKVGSWSLSPLPASVEIGEQVSLSVDQPPADRSIEYQFHFGDDSPASGWVNGLQANHRYHAARAYKPFVEIRRAADKPTNALAKTPEGSITVTPLPVSALHLDVTPAPPVQAGQPVTFTATLVSKFDKGDSHIRFKFVFGDGTSSDWQVQPAAPHTYSLAGKPFARVEAGWFDEQTRAQPAFAISEPRQIDVTDITQANPPPKDAGSNATSNAPKSGVTDPSQANRAGKGAGSVPGLDGSSSGFWRDLGRYWNIIIPSLAVIALAILFAGYQTLKGRFAVKPEYRAHRDIGLAQIGGISLAVEFDIRLKPDVIDAQYQVGAPEAGLIRYERRQRD